MIKTELSASLLQSFDLIQMLRVRVSGPAGIVGGGVNVQHSLHLQYHDEMPLSKTPKPQLLSRRRSINHCPLLRVCVHGVCVCVCVHGVCVCVHGVCVCVCVCTLDG